MTNEEIMILLQQHEDLCAILRHRPLSQREEERLLEIEEKLDALP